MSRSKQLLEEMRDNEMKLLLQKIYDIIPLNKDLDKIICKYKCIDDSYFLSDKEIYKCFIDLQYNIDLMPNNSTNKCGGSKIITYFDFLVNNKHWVYKMGLNDIVIKNLNEFKNEPMFEELYDHCIFKK